MTKPRMRHGFAKPSAPAPVTDLTPILAARGVRYGSFVDQAKIVWDIKRVFHNTKNWASLQDDQREALDMLANKVGRILNGDPDYDDSWHDIAGYCELVVKRLNGAPL